MTAAPEMLTPRQADALAVLTQYMDRHGYGPSRRDLAELLEIDVKAAHLLLIALHDKGWIRMAPRIARAITILHRPAPTRRAA